MEYGEMITWLGLGTLIAALIIALLLFVRFLRKPKNRHPMRGERERNLDEIREEKVDRAG